MNSWLRKAVEWHNELKEKVLYNAALNVLKYIHSRELPQRLPGIVQLFAQLTQERRGLDCLRAALRIPSSVQVGGQRGRIAGVSQSTAAWLSRICVMAVNVSL